MDAILWNHIELVRQKSPLIHNITNYVVMNNSANALLAIGASPVMAHALSELTNMVTISQALVVNIGTLDEYSAQSMLLAAAKANNLGKPWVLDPVGAGATTYRDDTLKQLLLLRPTVIRGNASEILALNKMNTKPAKGVDSTAESKEALEAALQLHQQYGSVVCVSGATDIIVGKSQTAYLHNGDELMSKVTGLGCSASAIIGAFVAVVPDVFEAVTAAMAMMGVAGELAAECSEGPGSLQVYLLDKLYTLNEQTFIERVKLNSSAV